MEDNFADRTFLFPRELAAAAGVSTDTLRHYERKGVLPRPHRAASGYRHYPKSSLDRLRLIRSSLAVGFTLDELASIFAERDKGGAPCRQVYGLAIKKLADMEDQIRNLSELRKRLREVVANWDAKLASAMNGEKIGLLHGLPKDLQIAGNGRPKLSPNKKRRKTGIK